MADLIHLVKNKVASANIVVVDNFFPKSAFLPLKDLLVHSPDLSWNVGPADPHGYDKPNSENSKRTIEQLEEIPCTDSAQFQLVHMFFSDRTGPQSPFYDTIIPAVNHMIDYFGLAMLIRIKANMSPATHKHYVSGFHRDCNWNGKNYIKHTVGILYMNSNNGYTLFKNGRKVESVENRFVFFPGVLFHSSVRQTDTSKRVVVNFNFITGEE